MNSTFLRISFKHWRTTWLQRVRELVFWRKHKYAWRSGYGCEGAGFFEYSVEALIRVLEIFGFGLAYTALESLFAGHRYRSLRAEEIAFAKTYFTEEELACAFLDEGAKYIAGSLKIAYVAGLVVKTKGRFHRRLLIHELVHVRQFRRWGWAYAVKALMAQWTGAGYDVPEQWAFAKTASLNKRRSFHPALNAEQEARRLEEWAMRKL